MNESPTAPPSLEAHQDNPSQIQWWNRIPLSIKLLATVLVVFLASIGYFQSNLKQGEPTAETLPVNLDQSTAVERQPAPNFSITNSSGLRTSVSAFKGKVAIVSFWASWCAPCLIELPTLRDLLQKIHDDNLIIAPVSVDAPGETRDFINQFWHTEKIPFETYYDPEKKAATQFKVETLPATFVLDKQGRIAMVANGANDWSADKTVETISQLLAEP